LKDRGRCDSKMSVGLDFVKTHDKKYRTTLILQPSGVLFSEMTCPYSKTPCSTLFCQLYDKHNKSCGMLISYLALAKILDVDNKLKEKYKKKR